MQWTYITVSQIYTTRAAATKWAIHVEMCDNAVPLQYYHRLNISALPVLDFNYLLIYLFTEPKDIE